MFSKEFIKKALQTPELQNPEFKRIWTDSRTLKKGDLFVAISGQNFDGHTFVRDAVTKGALGALVVREKVSDFKCPQGFDLIFVDDPIQALRSLASAYRETLTIPLFAVAGSNGKTTTKEYLSYLLKVLKGEDQVFKTEKSQNSILGIALSLLQIRNEKFAVIEVGIDEPGWMDQHLEVIRPTHGLITTIAEEHLNRLKNIETIAEEELKLFHFLKKTKGSFIANKDCPWISKLPELSSSISYSLTGPADIEGAFQAPQSLNVYGMHWENPLPGKHNAQNLLAAISGVAALAPLITKDEIKNLSQSILNFSGESHRSIWTTYDRDIQVFDDCYNANPDSMEKALYTFQELSDGCIQRVVLGDMLDLGDASDHAHHRILNLAVVLGFQHLYLFGSAFNKALNQMVQKPSNVTVFSEKEDLAVKLAMDLQPADTLMFKGSRGMGLEKIINKLKDIKALNSRSV